MSDEQDVYDDLSNLEGGNYMMNLINRIVISLVVFGLFLNFLLAFNYINFTSDVTGEFQVISLVRLILFVIFLSIIEFIVGAVSWWWATWIICGSSEKKLWKGHRS